MAKAGTYTLSVTFKQQKYNGSAWADTGVEDQKSVAFTVEQATVTPTAVPGQSLTPAAQKTAVETGDTTPVLPLMIVLVIAVVVIVGVLLSRKKRK
jgi:LPXTG-motif cell wall-anchored protein